MKTVFTYSLAFLFILGLGSSKIALAQNLKGNDLKYKVVINHEEQYSIVLADKKSPTGWKDTKISGTQSKCQEYIEEVWTDMRPLSIRKRKLSPKTQYQVVINHEEQYSILPADLSLPRGWKTAGVKGSLAKCTDHIKRVWTDMRPLSLRKSTARRKY